LAPDRLAGITHRQVPRAHSTLIVPPPPGALFHRHRIAPPSPTARRTASAMTIVTDLILVRLGARPRRQALY